MGSRMQGHCGDIFCPCTGVGDTAGAGTWRWLAANGIPVTGRRYRERWRGLFRKITGTVRRWKQRTGPWAGRGKTIGGMVRVAKVCPPGPEQGACARGLGRKDGGQGDAAGKARLLDLLAHTISWRRGWYVPIWTDLFSVARGFRHFSWRFVPEALTGVSLYRIHSSPRVRKCASRPFGVTDWQTRKSHGKDGRQPLLGSRFGPVPLLPSLSVLLSCRCPGSDRAPGVWVWHLDPSVFHRPPRVNRPRWPRSFRRHHKRRLLACKTILAHQKASHVMRHTRRARVAEKYTENPQKGLRQERDRFK